MNINLLVH